MSVNIPIRWADNTKELKANLKEGLDQIEVTRAAANKLVDSLSGDRVIAAAHKYAAAIGEIGGVEKLTAAERERANNILEKAIEKYNLLGKVAPAALEALAIATSKATTSTYNLVAGMTAAGLAANDSGKLIAGMGAAGRQAADTMRQTAEAAAKAMSPMIAGLSAAGKEASDSGRLIAGMSASGRLAADAMKQIEDAAKPSTASIGMFGGAFGQVLAGFSAASLINKAASGLSDLAHEALTTAGTLVDLSNKTGLSTETLQRMQFVAKQNGSDMQTFGDAAYKMGVNIEQGTKKARDAAEALGLSWQELRNASPDKQWEMVVQAAEKMEDPQKRNLALTELLGKTSKEVTAAIADGYTKIASQATVAGDAQVKAADAAGDALDRLRARSVAFSVNVLGTAAQAGEQAASSWKEVAQIFQESMSMGVGPALQLAALRAQMVNDRAKAKDISLPVDTVPQSFSAELAASTAAYKALSAAQKEEIAVAIQLGKSTDEIINNLNITEGVLSVAKKAYEDHKKALDQAAAASKKYADASKNLAAIMGDQFAILDKLSPARQKEIQDLAKAGGSVSDLAIKYSLTETEIKAVIKSGELLSEIQKLNTETTIASGEALSKLGHMARDADSEMIRLAATYDKLREIELGTALKPSELPGFKVDPKDDLKAIEESAKQVDDAFKQMAQALGQVGQIAGGTFGTILAGLGQMVPLIRAANQAQMNLDIKGATASPQELKQLQLAAGATKQATAAAGLGIAASLVSQNVNTGAGASTGALVAVGALQGAAAGAAMGSVVGPWGTAAGAGAGALVGLIQSGKEWRKVVNDIGRDFGNIHVSEDFAKMIDDLEDQTGLGRIQAITTQLDKLIEQAGGLNADNLSLFAGKLHDVFSFIERGELSVAQGAQVVDKNWASFLAMGTDAFGNISDQLKEIIKLNDTFGTQSKAIADYMKGQGVAAEAGFSLIVAGTASAVAGYDALKKAVDDAAAAQQTAMDAGDSTGAAKAAMDLHDALQAQMQSAGGAKQELSDLGIQAVASFTAAEASGSTELEALQGISPALSTLRQSYKDLGLSVDDVALSSLLFKNDILAANPQLVAAVGGLVQEQAALGNMGLLNADTFTAMEHTGSQMYTRLQAEAAALGGSTKDALGPMQDYLHEAELQAKALGLPLDKNTQMLIDQSKELGIWSDAGKSATDILNEGMKSLNDAVRDLIDTLRGIPPKVHTDVTVSTTVEPGQATDTPPDAEGHSFGGLVRYMATGGGAYSFLNPDISGPMYSIFKPKGTDTVPAMLTPGEGVITTTGMGLLGALNTGNVSAFIAPIAQGTMDAIVSAFDRHPAVMPTYAQGPGVTAAPPPGFSGTPTVTGGNTTYVNEFHINVTALDATDLDTKIEKDILPKIIAQVEDGRRGVGRRLSRALRANA